MRYRLTMQQRRENQFTTEIDETPEDYCEGCLYSNSVYGSWKKLDLWTYQLFIKKELIPTVGDIETLLFFQKI